MFPQILVFLCFAVSPFLSFGAGITEVFCPDVPMAVLTDILGPAYNSRYMSIDKPFHEEKEENGLKRNASPSPDFYVEEDFEQILDDKPAWVSSNHYVLDNPHAGENIRLKKSITDDNKEDSKPRDSNAENSQLEQNKNLSPNLLDFEQNETKNSMKKRSPIPAKQWHCEARITWTDLGPNYFPRYLRNVECLQKSCWFGHYKCKPRSFTVKLLRRRNHMCTNVLPGTKVGIVELPQELRLLWVWEERAVTFCCDCSYD